MRKKQKNVHVTRCEKLLCLSLWFLASWNVRLHHGPRRPELQNLGTRTSLHQSRNFEATEANPKDLDSTNGKIHHFLWPNPWEWKGPAFSDKWIDRFCRLWSFCDLGFEARQRLGNDLILALWDRFPLCSCSDEIEPWRQNLVCDKPGTKKQLPSFCMVSMPFLETLRMFVIQNSPKPGVLSCPFLRGCWSLVFLEIYDCWQMSKEWGVPNPNSFNMRINSKRFSHQNLRQLSALEARS